LTKFEPVDVSKVPLPAPKTVEKRAKEITTTIVFLTRLSQPIHIFYLVADGDHEDEPRDNTGPLDSSTTFWITWSAILSNGDELTLTTEEMLTSPNVFVQNAYLELDSTERHRTISKKKRIRAADKKKKEKEYIRLANIKQKEEEREEFEAMKLGIQTGNFDFFAFQGLVNRIRAPFCCEIDGVNVSVTPDDATVMFDAAALGVMKRVLVMESNNNNNNNNGPPHKRRRNTAAAETGLGLGCNQAHYQTDRHDRTQNAAAKATLLKQNLAEKDTIVEILTAVAARKDMYDQAMTKRRQEAGRIGCIAPLPVGFWVVGESDVKLSLRPFLRMFLPKYGYKLLGKTRQETLATIQNNPVELTESSVNAKVEALGRRLREVEQAIADAQTVETNE
jgi:hypothetical protein